MIDLHLLDSRHGQDNLQASHPASFQRIPSFYAHSVVDSRIYNHNNASVHQSGSYYDGFPQSPNFRHLGRSPPANDCPECLDPMFGIGFYHNGFSPKSNSVKSLTWSSTSRVTTEDRMQYHRRGNLSHHESQNSASVEPEAHSKSGHNARSQANMQGAIANPSFRADIPSQVLPSNNRFPLQIESTEDSIQKGKEAQFMRDRLHAMGSNHRPTGLDAWKRDQGRFFSCNYDRTMMQQVNSHIQPHFAIGTATIAHANIPVNIKPAPCCQPYHNYSRLPPPIEGDEGHNTRETCCTLQEPSNDLIGERSLSLIQVNEIPNHVKKDFSSKKLRYSSKLPFASNVIPYDNLFHRLPCSASHVPRESVIQNGSRQPQKYQNLNTESGGTFGQNWSRDMTHSLQCKEKRQRHVPKPYERPLPSYDIHARSLLFKYEEELLLRLKNSAEKNRGNLLCLISRLINPDPIPNALTLLEVLKVCDLTELIKERILSVIREHIWQAPPRCDLWEADHRRCRSYKDTDVENCMPIYANDISSQFSKPISTTANIAAKFENAKSAEDREQSTIPCPLTTSFEPKKSSHCKSQQEQNTKKEGNGIIKTNEVPDIEVKNNKSLPSTKLCFEGDVDIFDQVSTQVGNEMSERILSTTSDVISTDRNTTSNHPHKIDSDIDKVVNGIKQEEAVNKLKQCLKDFAESITIKEDSIESSEFSNTKQGFGSDRFRREGESRIKSVCFEEATDSEMEFNQQNMDVEMESTAVKPEPFETCEPCEAADDDTSHFNTMHFDSAIFPVIKDNEGVSVDVNIEISANGIRIMPCERGGVAEVQKGVTNDDPIQLNIKNVKTEPCKRLSCSTEYDVDGESTYNETSRDTEVDKIIRVKEMVTKTEPCDTPCYYTMSGETTSTDTVSRVTNNFYDDYWTDKRLLHRVKQEPEDLSNLAKEESDNETSIGNIFDKLLNSWNE